MSREASWAFASDKLGKWLLHLPSGVVGKVSEVHAPGEFLSSRGVEEGGLGEDNQLVRGVDLGERYISVAVIGFEDGNAFLSDPKNFLVLNEWDINVFFAMTKGVANLCMEILKVSGRGCETFESTPERVATVLRAALQAQLRVLTTS